MSSGPVPTLRPAPFSAFTTPEFWDDPHISERMLAFHLNPDNKFASRPAKFIDESVAWLVTQLDLSDHSRVLDLGCGPGLYAHRIARHGVAVTGIDVARRSIDYASGVARQESLPANFVVGNYLTCDLDSGFDAAIMIYEDYCVLSPDQRAALLARVREALRVGGRLLFDVTAAPRFQDFQDGLVSEPNLMDGFWAVGPYLGRRETWTYPEPRLVLERYTIKTADSVRQFWNWTQCLTPEQVLLELTAAGFASASFYGDVAGAPFDHSNSTFAVMAIRS